MKFKTREPGHQGLRPSRDVLTVSEVPDNLFNPELELSHKEFTAMLEKLEHFADQGKWRQFALLARDLKLLFPDRVAALHVDHTKKEAIKKVWTELAKKTVQYIQTSLINAKLVPLSLPYFLKKKIF